MKVPLKGIAIGNGWIDSKRQYPAYIDYAVKMGRMEENDAVSRYSSENYHKLSSYFTLRIGKRRKRRQILA